MQVKKVGVLGAGTMGQGIAQVCAEAGLNVVIVDIDQQIVDKAIQSITGNWDKALQKGKKSEEDIQKYKGLLSGAATNSSFSDCQIVIEAIVENIKIKQTVFKELDDICAPDAILASNTSALSITEIASVTKRADKVVGVHFFNPVPAMKLIEIVPGAETDPAIVAQMVEFSKFIGKEPIPVKESPGFIVNRLLIPYINEAAIIYGEGVASAEEIDTAMKLGANMPIGPLALADLIGIDVCLMIMDYFWQETGDSKYRPALAMKTKVRANALGRKSGKGFFNYGK